MELKSSSESESLAQKIIVVKNLSVVALADVERVVENPVEGIHATVARAATLSKQATEQALDLLQEVTDEGNVTSSLEHTFQGTNQLLKKALDLSEKFTGGK